MTFCFGLNSVFFLEIWIDRLTTGRTWLKNKTKIKIRVKTVKTILWSFGSLKFCFMIGWKPSQFVAGVKEAVFFSISNTVATGQGKKFFKVRQSQGIWDHSDQSHTPKLYVHWFISWLQWWKHAVDHCGLKSILAPRTRFGNAIVSYNSRLRLCENVKDISD